MSFKYYNERTGQYEVLTVPTLKGERGERGETGAPGAKGEVGATPNLTIGTVTTLEPEQQATVTIGGTKENPVLNFGIPRGADGKDGQGGNEDVPVNTVHYEGEAITATNTVNHLVTNALFKGRTMVNLLNFDKLDSKLVKNGNKLTASAGNSTTAWTGGRVYFAGVIERNKKYIVMWDDLEYTHTSENRRKAVLQVMSINISTNRDLKLEQSDNTTNNYMIFTCTDANADLTKVGIQINATTWATGETGNTTTVTGLKVFEYQDGMENWDIPYIEGMANVKAPTVKTVGKNLFDGELKMANLTDGGEEQVSKQLATTSNFIKVFSQMTFKSYDLVRGDVVVINRFIEYDKNKNFIRRRPVPLANSCTYTPTDSKVKFVKVTFRTPALKDITLEEFESVRIQIEEGSVATTYEPHKSNILSTPEDLELRGIGDVCDTVDCITGELVNNYGIITIDGDFVTSTNSIIIPDAIVDWTGSDSHIKADNLPTRIYNGSDSVTTLTLALHGGRVYFRGFIGTLDELKSHFNTTPTRFQYRLAEKSIKTVDLKGQKVYSYDGTTHYTCSAAEGSLVPTLSIDVPTNLPALVSHQRATIQALTVENQEIKAVNEAQDIEIELNQEAINFMLFHSTSMMLSEQTKGTNMMAVYLANQILKGRLDYTLVISRYAEFKDDIDSILNSEGKQELIQ